MRLLNTLSAATLAIGVMTACSGGDSVGAAANDASVGGDAPAIGGTSANGGSAGSGGTSANGGGAGSGGTSANGGSAGSGGTSANGGSSGSGGTSANGGSSGSGGTSANGGSAGADGIADAGDSGGSGGSVTDAGADAATGPAVCNDLVNDGAFVTATGTLAARPAASGGSVTPGRYHLTAWTFYGIVPTPAPVIKLTMVITGDAGEAVGEDTGGHGSTYSFTYSVDDTTTTQVQTCPLPRTTTALTYDATPTTLTLYSAVADGVSTVQQFTID